MLKCLSARPQRVKARSDPLRYVEGLNDARTKPANVFSILRVICSAWPVTVLPGSEECNG